MMNLFSRAAPCARASLLRPSLPIRPLSTTTRACAISYKANPNPAPNPTRRQRIPPQKRPLSRDPIPERTKTDEELSALPYIVTRTPYAQLPLYRKFKGGGTLQVVMVKKVQGDKKKMVDELADAVKIDKEQIRINPVTQHIELKGDYFSKTRDWLLQQGF